MSIYDVAYLYVVRLRARGVLVQELFAVLGIAVGVGLLFASQVAIASFGGSVAQLTSGVSGHARYQLEARSAAGFSERVLGEVQGLPGVRAAVPVLEAQIGLVGPAGKRAVYLLATDPRYVHLTGALLGQLTPGELAGARAILLPAPLAAAIRAEQLQVIDVQVGAHLVPTLLGAVLNRSELGPLIHSQVAVAPLRYAQSLTGMQGRLSRVLVQVRPGRDAEVLRGMRRLAAGHLSVVPANFDTTLFDEAAMPINQSVSVFAAICALVGFMFAYCAVLLTAHLRRRLLSELRMLGAPPRQIVKVLLFDAAAGSASRWGTSCRCSSSTLAPDSSQSRFRSARSGSLRGSASCWPSLPACWPRRSACSRRCGTRAAAYARSQPRPMPRTPRAGRCCSGGCAGTDARAGLTPQTNPLAAPTHSVAAPARPGSSACS